MLLFEIITTSSMVGVLFSSFYFQRSAPTNDHEKIIKIADAADLKKKGESIRIYKKRQRNNHVEYVYKIPLGLSFKDFEEKKQLFIDGLNNKSSPDFKLKYLKDVDWKGDVIKQVKNIINNRSKLDKQIEMEYDGMLKIRVYDQGLSNMYEFSEDLLRQGWEVPIGYSYKELLTHDFEGRPHMIVAGATGFGKSEYLKLLLSVLIRQNPEYLRLHLIDLKGGSELGPFRNLKQTVAFARETETANDVLRRIKLEMNQKLDALFEQGIKDVKRAGQKERDFIFIDEAANLDKDGVDLVTDIVRRGRSAGYRVIYATQYPTNETLASQVRANIGVRVCFRLETNAQSRAALDEGGAEELPEIEGRAIFRKVKNHIVQVPYINDEQINEVIKPYVVEEGMNASCETKKYESPGGNTIIFEEA